MLPMLHVILVTAHFGFDLGLGLTRLGLFNLAALSPKLDLDLTRSSLRDLETCLETGLGLDFGWSSCQLWGHTTHCFFYSKSQVCSCYLMALETKHVN